MTEPEETPKRLALRIAAESLRGMRVGVPRLVDLLRERSAGATFFFDFGPDRSGRRAKQLKRQLSPSALAVADPLERFGRLGLFHGVLWPGPRLAWLAAKSMRAARDAGFEVGLRAWSGVEWTAKAPRADGKWTERTMRRAARAFERVFGEPPRAHAAPDWVMNVHAFRLTQRLGFDYGADSRGEAAFVPVHRAELVACPQLPTTLPTLDELVMAELSVEAAVERLLAMTAADPREHTFAASAELEGQKLAPEFARLLDGWLAQGYEIVALRTLLEGITVRGLPRHCLVEVVNETRDAMPAVQGSTFLA